MADKPLSLQDRFLNGVRKARSQVTIFLVKGVKLQGMVTWFDPFSILLRRESASQLVYKHAISTIIPERAPADLLADLKSPSGRQCLQDIFLAAAARERQVMTLFLVNGVMLQGTVAGYDQFSVLIERDGQCQLIYKHALSTLQSAAPLDLGRDGEGEIMTSAAQGEADTGR